MRLGSRIQNSRDIRGTGEDQRLGVWLFDSSRRAGAQSAGGVGWDGGLSVRDFPRALSGHGRPWVTDELIVNAG